MKNCIYYCFCGDIKYGELLFLSLQSLLKYDQKCDILVFTEYDIAVDSTSNEFNSVKFITTKFPVGHAPPLAYRFILGSELSKIYDNVLYLDLDIIITNSLDNIFMDITDYKISVSRSGGSIIDKYYAGELLDENERDLYKKIDGFSSGVFALNNTCASYLYDIYNLIIDAENKGFYGCCYDQHGFCYYIAKGNLYEYNLDKYVDHNAMKTFKDNSWGIGKHLIYHFAGGVGNVIPKNEMMKNVLNCAKYIY